MILSYKQQIESALVGISAADLKLLVTLAFDNHEKGDPYAEGANDVIGALTGAYDIQEVIDNLRFRN